MSFEQFLEDPFLPAGWRDHEEWIRLGWNAARIGKSLKPFHPDHIGKPWFEIPGGME